MWGESIGRGAKTVVERVGRGCNVGGGSGALDDGVES